MPRVARNRNPRDKVAEDPSLEAQGWGLKYTGALPDTRGERSFRGRGEGLGAIPFAVFAALAVGLVACLLIVTYVLARRWF